MRRLAVASVLALLMPLSGWTCPGIEYTLTEILAGAPVVAIVRVTTLQDVADTPVAELSVVEDLHGTLPEAAAYLPADFIDLPPGETLVPGMTALLITRGLGDYQATRRFWADVDALRGDAPLLETMMPTLLPIDGDGIALPASLRTDDEPGEPIVVDGEPTPWRHMSADRFLIAVREELARPAALPDDSADPH
jgi:hypothetical protein